ncbi:MAG: hypothetical protein QNJ44_22480 [Rhodobacter sp.]|nr:hypothetical protein [Rhodobacter sp.]
MKEFFDLQLPFYRPLWIRLAVTGVCGGMALMDLARGQMFWAVLFGAVAIYCAYQFFVVFDPVEPEEDEKT